jgi:hypothetical protein
MERRMPTQSRYLEGKDGYHTNIIISILGKDIPHARRCINHITWSYLGAAKNRRVGSPDSICEQKVVKIRAELEHYGKGRPSYGLRTTKIQT